MRVSESERVTCVQTVDPERPENAESENEFISQYCSTRTRHTFHTSHRLSTARRSGELKITHTVSLAPRAPRSLITHSLKNSTFTKRGDYYTLFYSRVE